MPTEPRKPQPTSSRAACLHLGHAQAPAPTLASTRAAWLREGRAPFTSSTTDDGFDWSKLLESQRVGLQRVLSGIRKADPYFDLVYKTLAGAHKAYGFTLNPTLTPYGQFVPNSKERGGIITFRTIQGALNLETTNEEFFHAYQNYFYGRSRMNHIGGSNIELEPRFMDAYKKVNSDNGFGTMPGQERMFNLIFNVDSKATGLTSAQQKEYLNSVEEFRQRWIVINKKAHTDNLYDDPKTTDGPAAAFDLINKVRRGKK